MSMVVQHNLQAMNSNRMLGITTSGQAKSTEKLSSGFKINRAADDAAGLTISEKMRKQMRGLDRASTNAQDGVSAVQTSEGALTEVHSMLQRMNELAVQASNGTNSESDRDAIQAEINQLSTEIDRVAETTKFNEIYLLKGDKSTKTIELEAHNAGLKGELTTEKTADGTVGKFQAAELKNGQTVAIGGINYTIGDSADGVTAASKVEKALADAVKDGKADDKITIDGTEYTAAAKAPGETVANTPNTAIEEKQVEDIIKLAVNTTNPGNGASIRIKDSDGNETTYTYSKIQTEANLKDTLDKAVNGTGGTATTIDAGDSITIGDTKYEAVDISKVVTMTGAKATTGTGFYSTTYMKAGGTVTLDGKTYTYLAKEATGASEATGIGIYYKADDGEIIEAKDIKFKEGDSYSTDGTAANTIRVSDKIAAGTGHKLYDKDGNEFQVPDAIEDGAQVSISIKALKGAAVADPTLNGTYVAGASGEQEGFYDEKGNLLTEEAVADLVTAGTEVTFTDGLSSTSVPGTPVYDTTFSTALGANTAGAAGAAITVASGQVFEVGSLAWKDADGNELTKDMMTGLKDNTEVKISSTGDEFVVGTPSDSITKEQAYEKMAEELKAANSIGTTDDITVTNNEDGTFEFNLGTVEVADTLAFNLHVGADSDLTNKIDVRIDTMNSAFLGIKGLDVIGKGNDGGIAATYAIAAIADAISKVSEQRSALGAVQNRLEHTIANLDNVVENTTAAESRIRDTDMAKEMVEYSKNNILAQAGQSMLAQANQSTQGVLSLLG